MLRHHLSWWQLSLLDVKLFSVGVCNADGYFDWNFAEGNVPHTAASFLIGMHVSPLTMEFLNLVPFCFASYFKSTSASVVRLRLSTTTHAPFNSTQACHAST